MFLFPFQKDSLTPSKPAGSWRITRKSAGQGAGAVARQTLGKQHSPSLAIQRQGHGKLRSEGQATTPLGSGGWLGTGLTWHLQNNPQISSLSTLAHTEEARGIHGLIAGEKGTRTSLEHELLGGTD